MSDTTPRLGLATVGDHSQKRIVMNEALMALDSLVQARVLSRTTAAQPSRPVDGDAYILPASPTGDVWGELSAGTVVRSESATWETVAFPDGAIVHVADENRFVIRSGGTWAAFEDVIKALDNLAHLGIGTTADSFNVLALKGAAALLSAQYAAGGGSGDIALIVNKETTADTAQLLLQKDYSARAVLGLLGDDSLTLKVSPDGATYVTAVKIDATTGVMALANGQASAPQLAFNGNYGLFYDTANAGIGAAVAGTQQLYLNGTAFQLTGRSGGQFNLNVLADSTLNCSYQRYSTDASASVFNMRKARGSQSAPAVPVTSDVMGTVRWGAYTGSAFTASAELTATLIETATVDATHVGSRLMFSICPVGSGTRTEVMRLEAGSGLSMFGGNVVIDQNRNVRARVYTVATLPTAATAAGQRAQVSDASSPAFAVAVAGGGSAHSPVYSDGSTWRCG